MPVARFAQFADRQVGVRAALVTPHLRSTGVTTNPKAVTLCVLRLHHTRVVLFTNGLHPCVGSHDLGVGAQGFSDGNAFRLLFIFQCPHAQLRDPGLTARSLRALRGWGTVGHK